MIECTSRNKRLITVFLLSLFSSDLALAGKDTLTMEGGAIYVHGILTQSPCRFEMDSEWQDINLGVVSTSAFKRIGNKSKPVSFVLNITDCITEQNQIADGRTGLRYLSPSVPAIRVGFDTANDIYKSKLVVLNGVSGLAFRIQEADGTDIRIQDYGRPFFIDKKNYSVKYNVTLERIPGPLVVGNYNAIVNYHLIYE